MSQSLDEALTLIAERARNDPELTTALRTVLTEMLARLPEAAPEPVLSPVPGPIWEEPEPLEPFEEPAEREPAYAAWPDLNRVAENLALKAQAARWVARHGYTEERDALGERYALLDRARSENLYLWMFDRNRVDPDAQGPLTELAELYELTVQALSFWQDAADTPEEREADRLLAEAQAALRVAAQGFGKTSDDDQYNLYKALRLSAQASRTYLPQLSLGYDPHPVQDLQAQLQALAAAKAQRETNERAVKKLGSKARYLAGLVQRTPSDVTQWRKVDEVRAELEALEADVTELLAPLRGLTVPDELPELAARLTVPEPVPEAAAPRIKDAPSTDVPSAHVTHVRKLLTGREVVIVGGEVRPEATVQLEAAFGCSVRWLDAAPHTSLSVLSPAITEEVAVVLLLIRWSSHVYGELVHVCKARGVPLVRLAGGYSPNRVAHDVLEQAEERLSFQKTVR